MDAARYHLDSLSETKDFLYKFLGVPTAEALS
jgi:hypothetical protein